MVDLQREAEKNGNEQGSMNSFCPAQIFDLTFSELQSDYGTLSIHYESKLNPSLSLRLPFLSSTYKTLPTF